VIALLSLTFAKKGIVGKTGPSQVGSAIRHSGEVRFGSWLCENSDSSHVPMQIAKVIELQAVDFVGSDFLPKLENRR
jgi:hypothetical protein